MVAWAIMGALQTIYDHFLLGSHLSSGYGEGYIFLKSLVVNTIGGLIGGVVGGNLLVYVVNKKFRSAPYYRGVIIVGLTIIFGLLLITFLLAVLQVTILYGGFKSELGIEMFNSFIYTTEHVKNIMYWAGVVSATQLGLHINDKFGQGLLWSMITGKYHLPTSEERIFMFLDLKGSTSIAEKLGNKTYHNFLKDVFSDITNPILSNLGQIYQYVGDEVVISWPQESGLVDNRCIDCFFDVQSKLKSLKNKYIEKYQLEPIFKAGIHHGRIVAGEIGIIKRDITYSGDTLNTAARIQGMCNKHQSQLLISGSLAQLMKLSLFTLKSLGSMTLRGKKESLEILSVEQNKSIRSSSF